jgi:hypothetical protein
MSKWNPNFLAALWQQSANSSMSSGTVKLAMLADSYTPSDAHDFFDDVSASVIGTPVTLTSKTFTNGVFNAVVPNYDGDELDTEDVGFMQIFIDTGTPSTSRLVYLFDGDEAQLPFTGLGADQPVTLPDLPLCDADTSGDSLYPLFAQALFEQPSNSSVSAGTLKLVGFDASFSFNVAHDFFADIAGGDLTGTAQTLGSKSYTAGVLDAADPTFPGGVTDLRGFLAYLDTGSSATSRLVGVKRNVQALPGGGLTTAEDLPVALGAGLFALGAETP